MKRIFVSILFLLSVNSFSKIDLQDQIGCWKATTPLIEKRADSEGQVYALLRTMSASPRLSSLVIKARDRMISGIGSPQVVSVYMEYRNYKWNCRTSCAEGDLRLRTSIGSTLYCWKNDNSCPIEADLVSNTDPCSQSVE